MKLNILAFGAHPDDVEMSASGTLYKHKLQGQKIGIVDLTRGEMGTRGTIETRYEEAKKASEILKLDVRENLCFEDCFFENNKEHQLKIISILRKYKPDTVLINAKTDRHLDHSKAHNLLVDSCFLSGLRKIETTLNNEIQEVWRPFNIFSYIQEQYSEPDFVVDISEFIDIKMNSILAYKTQFYSENNSNNEPLTHIAKKEYIEFIKARSCHYGNSIGTHYGEGFKKIVTMKVNNFRDLI